MIFLDTNAVIFLYAGDDRFPPKARTLIEQSEMYVSPMVRLELQYLFEVKRAKHPAKKIIDTLYKELGLIVHNYSFDPIILNAIDAPFTRDPFDRIITAHAMTMDAPLITSDHVILKKYKKATWE